MFVLCVYEHVCNNQEATTEGSEGWETKDNFKKRKRGRRATDQSHGS